MKLTSFNPVQEAIQSQAGFSGMAGRQFRKSLCWCCQKDKPRLLGKTSMTQQGNAAYAKGAGAPTNFVCAECLEKKAKRLAEKENT